MTALSRLRLALSAYMPPEQADDARLWREHVAACVAKEEAP